MLSRRRRQIFWTTGSSLLESCHERAATPLKLLAAFTGLWQHSAAAALIIMTSQRLPRNNAAIAECLLTALFAACFLLPTPGSDGRIAHLPSVCPFYNLTGLPCPGCGLTRSFVCLAHGQWQEALHWHPLGWVVFFGLAVFWLRNGYFLAFGRLLFPLSPNTGRWISYAGAAALLCFGALRIGWLTLHHLRF